MAHSACTEGAYGVDKSVTSESHGHDWSRAFGSSTVIVGDSAPNLLFNQPRGTGSREVNFHPPPASHLTS